MTRIVEVPAGETSDVRCDLGVDAIDAADLRWHAPDLSLLAVHDGSLSARCSVWVRDGLGVIGHYAAASPEAGHKILDHACATLRKAGCKSAVGPMDGNTWRRYRFIVDRGKEPAFFLEPDHCSDWPRHWIDAGFSPAAFYSSSLNSDLSVEDARTPGALTRLQDAGISIREFDREHSDRDLGRLFRLSSVAFCENPFYEPVSREEFDRQHRAVLPLLRSELVLLAERGEELVGFMFALPDLLQRPGAPPTVVLKTMAVHPDVGGMGLGSALMDLAQRAARRLGFTRVIHALMHESNASGRLSARYATPFRRYALFARPLT